MPGIIKRIAGPVVFVYGLENPKKNYIVEVGEERLLGEIIQLRGDTSVIQVYEETSGLGIKEPVYAINRPLTVRLGPGVMSTVYDGIQRPLDLLEGSFIGRGEKTNPLDLSKKWRFIPEPNLTPGTKLQGGEILGRVQETESVENRILVPPDVHGTLKELAPEGDYIVTDNIASVQSSSLDQDLPLYHDWPVRQPRPFKSRILSDKPFLTGQRILDFLYPLVEGGSAMIPGGFGTGKCVTSETPLMLSNGDIVKIEEFYNSSLKSNGILEIDTKSETLVKLIHQPEVLALNGKGFETKKATYVYRGKSNRILKVMTRTGRKVNLTPIHKLHLYNGTDIVQIEADNLSTGDYIVVPRKINIQGEEIKFDAYQLDDSLRVADEKAIDSMINEIRKMSQKATLKEQAELLGIPYSTFIGYWKKRKKPTLSFLKQLSKFSNIPLIDVKALKSERHSKPFYVPGKMTPELAEWLGLFVADGHIKGNFGNIHLYNNSKQILSRFKELTKKVFNLDANFISDSEDKTPSMRVINKTLVEFLHFLGIPRKEKTYTIGVPASILRSPEGTLIHFLNGYIAGDGSFYKYTIELSTASKK
ncbi:MAG: LAGLIDADG family homing endonuclease, partial [Candidatus Hodarchaeales archaeon]